MVVRQWKQFGLWTCNFFHCFAIMSVPSAASIANPGCEHASQPYDGQPMTSRMKLCTVNEGSPGLWPGNHISHGFLLLASNLSTSEPLRMQPAIAAPAGHEQLHPHKDSLSHGTWDSGDWVMSERATFWASDLDHLFLCDRARVRLIRLPDLEPGYLFNAP